MKPFKRTYDFKLFEVRVVLMFSTYRYGYKRGEKLNKPDPNQMVIEFSKKVENEKHSY